jgi:phospho-N-acetylmuramoyl-pentapeptide-transferase
MAWTPLLTRYLYKHKCWKKKIRTVAVDGRPATVIAKIQEGEVIHTPRMGGLLIWVTTTVLVFLFYGLSGISDTPYLQNFNFLSRSQTWIPVFTLFAASVIGLVDDIFAIQGVGESDPKGGGIRVRHRLLRVSLVGLVGALWMYFKLDWHTLHVPFWGDLDIGFLFIPLFILVMDIFFMGSVVDGIDGLSGGILAIVFATFSLLSFVRGQYDLAAFCAVIVGATITFLWFNIPPARFYLSETGIIGLGATLAVVSFFNDSVLLLPLFAIIIVLEVATNVLQLASKKLRNGKKIFLAAPIHHHFQAKGWPSYKVTMRFWLISALGAMVGLIIAILDVVVG